MNSLTLIIAILLLSFQYVINSNKDYIFDLPDISFEYGGNNLNAYKSPKNDEIINDVKINQYGNLRWISIGNPQLIQSNDETSLAHFTDESVSFYFKMLTNTDKIMLQDHVKRVKLINVPTSAFIDLEPNSLECRLKIYNKETNKSNNLIATVNNFRNTPYELIFQYTEGTSERSLLQERIKRLSKSPISIYCKVKAGSSEKKTNTFQLTVANTIKLGLVDKLFGDASEIYVTRDQLTELSQEICSSLNVIEDYQIKEEEFSTKFVDDLIESMGSSGAFKSVPFEDAFNSLSKYSLGFEKDLEPNIIKEAVENSVKIEKVGSKNHLRFDSQKFTDQVQDLAKSEKDGLEISGGYGPVKVSFEKTSEYVNNNKERWIKSDKTLDDQLKEINNINENKIEFAFKGEKIYPKSLKVSKIQSSTFKKDLSFKRIKNFILESNLTLHFTLSSTKYNNEVNELRKEINSLKLKSTTTSTITSTASTTASTIATSSSATSSTTTSTTTSTTKLTTTLSITSNKSSASKLNITSTPISITGTNTLAINKTPKKTETARKISLIRTITDDVNFASSLAVLQNGNLVSCSHDYKIKVWNPIIGSLIQTLIGHEYYVYAMTVLQNGNLVSGSYKEIKIWNQTNGALSRTFVGHEYYVMSFTVLKNGNLASGSYREIKIWNPTTGALIQTLAGHTYYVYALTVLKNGNLASGSYAEINLWNTTSGLLIQVLKGHSYYIYSLTVLQDGTLVSGSYQEVKLWNPETGVLRQTLTGYNYYVYALTVLKNGNLASGSYQEIKIWSPKTNELIQTLTGHKDYVRALTVLDNGELVSAARDRSIKTWGYND